VVPIAIKIFEAALQSPIIRGFLEGVCLKIFADIWFHPSADNFQPQFKALMQKLSVAGTVQEKQDVLRQIQDLRAQLAFAFGVQPSPAAAPAP
jgi:hypothetical protein